MGTGPHTEPINNCTKSFNINLLVLYKLILPNWCISYNLSICGNTVLSNSTANQILIFVFSTGGLFDYDLVSNYFCAVTQKLDTFLVHIKRQSVINLLLLINNNSENHVHEFID